MSLDGRAVVCPNSNYTKCAAPGLPDNFCCAISSTCMVLNSGKSALCCPQGGNCSVIGSIACDLQQQNATANPFSQLFTTDLFTPLPTCGSLCCPAGMVCENEQCVLLPPSSTSMTASPTSPAAPASSVPSAVIASPTIKPPAANKFAAPGVLVGFFTGLIAGLLLMAVTVCYIGRQRDSKAPPPIQVSDPIFDPQAGNSFRSDFLRRGSAGRAGPLLSRASSKARGFLSRTPTIKTLWTQSSSPISELPGSPERRRKASEYTIKMMYNPDPLPTRGPTPSAEFSEMLKQAGLEEHEPYLRSRP